MLKAVCEADKHRPQDPLGFVRLHRDLFWPAWGLVLVNLFGCNRLSKDQVTIA